MSFQSRPINPSNQFGPKVNQFLRRHPSAFGIPFLVIIVGASFGLKSFTDLGVEKKDTKITTVTQDEEVRRKIGNARPFDIREEYYRHFSKHPNVENWDNVRIQRPDDAPEWGAADQDTRKRVTQLVKK